MTLKHLLIYYIISISLIYFGYKTGELVGYNEGWDIGTLIGRLDSEFEFRHNGVIE